MCAGEWNGCCIPGHCTAGPCGREPFPRPCPDPPSICRPDPPGWQVPVSCAPESPPPFGPPGCRPGPEICISRPCVEDCRPRPPRPLWQICRPRPPKPACPPEPCGRDSCREEYFASFREFRIAQLIEALNRMIGGCR